MRKKELLKKSISIVSVLALLLVSGCGAKQKEVQESQPKESENTASQEETIYL